MLFLLTDNLIVSRGGGEGGEKGPGVHGQNHNDNPDCHIIPFARKAGKTGWEMGKMGGGGGKEVSTSLKEILRLLETPKFCLTSRDRLSREFPVCSERSAAAISPPGPALATASLPRSPARSTSLACSPAPDWFFWFSLPPWDALGDPMTSLAESLPLPPPSPPLPLVTSVQGGAARNNPGVHSRAGSGRCGSARSQLRLGPRGALPSRQPLPWVPLRTVSEK
ncbi:uncharacterized protein LOC135232453 [Loxodonta africana]|uniref:uncharacterized protein LOC135232453 n=1 Tax=Loxodonta africana TaxID=9785 RepID=UPI0030D0B1CE